MTPPRRRLAAAALALAATLGPAAPSAAAGFFSDGYVPPASKQGVAEAMLELPPAVLAERSGRLARYGAGYVQYNLFWVTLEPAGVPSSPKPLACPAGHRMEPSSEAERVRLGFHRFRCIDAAALARYDALFARDRAYGFQSGVVLWGLPPGYREPGCGGAPAPIGTLSCAPRTDASDDFEDYVNLVASRWNGSGERGKVSHFILWNENAAPEYLDLSPAAPNGDVSPAAVERRIDVYAGMLKRAHAALTRHQTKALLYVSTDALWEPGLRRNHIGSRRLLEGLWDRLGTGYSWSVAVHPYGRAGQSPRRGFYGYANLDTVLRYQEAQMRRRGLPVTPDAPWTRLIASEQGWGLKEFGREGQAEQVCRAHAAAMRYPTLVAEANTYFQSTEPDEEAAGAASAHGAFFGLLPHRLPPTLAGMESVPTGQAYIATFDARNWGRSDAHYCCATWGEGCRGRP